MNRYEFVTEAPLKYIKIFDGEFYWSNFINKSSCNLKVFSFGRDKIAIATESKLNPGMSVTNGAEFLWLNVIKEYGNCECFETHDGLNFDSVHIERGKATWSMCVGEMEEILRGLK